MMKHPGNGLGKILNFSWKNKPDTIIVSTSSEEAPQGQPAGTSCSVEWEMRPGGMLVQKRNFNFPPNLCIRVHYGTLRFHIPANLHSTFGEVKKVLVAETGLEASEQRLIFRGKERGNGEYLDRCRVKDGSKVTLMEAPESKERKLLDMHRNAKIQALHRVIDGVYAEIDTLEDQVRVIEKSIAHGDKVAELHITTLTQMLMTQAVKLDSIILPIPNSPHHHHHAASAKKDLQEKRIHKCVETLDMLQALNEREGKRVVDIDKARFTTKWASSAADEPAGFVQWDHLFHS